MGFGTRTRAAAMTFLAVLFGGTAPATVHGFERDGSTPPKDPGIRYQRDEANPAPLAGPIVDCPWFTDASFASEVSNGSFESGDFTGWSTDDAGSGNWLVTDELLGPLSLLPLQPPSEGTFQAVVDQTGPGRHILWQDITVPAGNSELHLVYWLENLAGIFIAPPTLDHTAEPNQQMRIDIMDPAAPIDDVGAGVLMNLFVTNPGSAVSVPPTMLSTDLSAFAGQTIRLRVVEVDNLFFFTVGLDAVATMIINAEPICDAGGPYNVDCGESVQLDGTGSSDADGDSLSYAWTTTCPGATFNDPGSPTPMLTLASPCGCTLGCDVTLTVDDGLASSSCRSDVSINLIVSAIELWPPNHKYETLTVEDCLGSLLEGCPVDGFASVAVVGVSSDEAENAIGLGDGNTLGDMVIECPNTVWLRKERHGTGNGRVYTISYAVTDLAGRVGMVECKVGVPHSEDGGPAVEGPGPGDSVEDCGEAPITTQAPVSPAVQLARRGRSVGMEFALPRDGTVHFDVFDVRGRNLHSDSRVYPAGRHTIYWNGATRHEGRAAAGLYLMRLRASGTVHKAKVLLTP